MTIKTPTVHTATHSYPEGAILAAGGQPWSDVRRRELRRQLRHGELDQLEFQAIVFRTGPNSNHVRFRDADLPAFARSFAQVPFLRNHDTRDVAARDGIVLNSHLVGDAFQQTIRLTTERGMVDFLSGILDRFSVSWNYSAIECSICRADWMNCPHWPGQRYAPWAEPGAGLEENPAATPGPNQGQACELIFLDPQGKETSAVNTPAVPGTHILDSLCQLKEQTYPMTASTDKVYPVPTTTPAIPSSIDAPSPILFPPEASPVQVQLTDLQAELVNLRTTVAQLRDGPMQEQIAGLHEDITTLRSQLATEADRHLVTGVRPIVSQMQTPMDRAQLSMDWLFGDRKAPVPPPAMRNLADLYQALTGDVNWYGKFDPAYAQLASATTTTLAGLVVNAMNKVTLQYFNNMMTYRWYESIVNVLPHNGDGQTIDMLSLDSLTVLPTVAEGQAYTELTVGDARETMTFSKRGAYVGITLEAIRRSDIQRLQAIPRELVKSAIRTRSAAIAAIFTTAAGLGPTLAQDSVALFNAAHGSNIMNSALTATTWAIGRTTIFEQTIPGGGSLGIWPSFLLVPIELYDPALVLFGYGAGDIGRPIAAATAQEVNPYAESRLGDPRPTVIVVPEWTDATNWACITDPRLQPVIHMAYANQPQGGSHPMPEIYEVTSETSGLMFSNDTLPVKARDWWTHGVSTWVGVANNVNP